MASSLLLKLSSDTEGSRAHAEHAVAVARDQASKQVLGRLGVGGGEGGGLGVGCRELGCCVLDWVGCLVCSRADSVGVGEGWSVVRPVERWTVERCGAEVR